MKTTDCRHTQREIDSSELNQRLSDDSMAHISGCMRCRELLDRASSLRSLVAGLETVSAPPDFDMRLRARLATEKRPNATWINFWRQAPGVPAIAFAFSLLVLITVALYLRSSSTPQVAGTLQPAAPSVAITKPAETTAAKTQSTSATQTGGNLTGGGDASVSAPEPANRPTGVRRAGKPTPELTAVAKSPGIASREYSVNPAETVNRDAGANGNLMSPVVSLSAPAQRVVVSMRDNHGATRTISLPPVSFGSQRLGYQSVSLASSGKGAW